MKELFPSISEPTGPRRVYALVDWSINEETLTEAKRASIDRRVREARGASFLGHERARSATSMFVRLERSVAHRATTKTYVYDRTVDLRDIVFETRSDVFVKLDHSPDVPAF